MLADSLIGVKEHYGEAGVDIGGIIIKQIEGRSMGLKVAYNCFSRRFTIVNSGHLSLEILHKMLYETPVDCEYAKKRWYPIVEERDVNGNIEVALSSFPVVYDDHCADLDPEGNKELFRRIREMGEIGRKVKKKEKKEKMESLEAALDRITKGLQNLNLELQNIGTIKKELEKMRDD